MTSVIDGIGWGLIALSVAGCVYLIVALSLLRQFVGRREDKSGPLPPVSVLKPLCGAESALYDNLRSFCVQTYPTAQIVFGVRDADDPAIAVVERLVAEFPFADLNLVVDPSVHGANLKISNLMNMIPAAKHDILVIADSDMDAPQDYLRHVAPPLNDPGIGLVTCLYTGQPVAGMWSKLGAMFINHGFLPSALVGRATGRRSDCFGATMALRRDTLVAIGGLERFVDLLADDHALGDAVASLGLGVALPPVILATTVDEPSFSGLWRHELRWALTLRLIEPLAFAGTIVTYPVPLALIALALTGTLGTIGASAAAIFALAMLCRIATMRGIDRTLGLKPTGWWLIPLRDMLSAAIVAASYCVKTVEWRGRAFRVAADGHLTVEKSRT